MEKEIRNLKTRELIGRVNNVHLRLYFVRTMRPRIFKVNISVSLFNYGNSEFKKHIGASKI